MKIEKRRIRTLGHYLAGIKDGESFFIAIPIEDVRDVRQISKIGFTNHLNFGEQVLPRVVGTVSSYNANGSFLKHRNLPKETVIRQAEIKDWHGHYHLVDIPYQRYPRTKLAAPEIELTIVEGIAGGKLIRAPRLVKGQSQEALIIHVINLFLEFFGVCQTLRVDLIPVLNVPVTRLNWDLLPPGRYPWGELKRNVQSVIGREKESIRRVIERRLELISSHEPSFVAVGNAGFAGYIVFGFEGKPFYILESMHEGNATYVFGQNWQELSQMTKETILNEDLHLHRFIHRTGWGDAIDGLF